MWDSGFEDYIDDWWNLMDFIMNSLYLATISLKIVAYIKVIYIKGFYLSVCLFYLLLCAGASIMLEKLTLCAINIEHV